MDKIKILESLQAGCSKLFSDYFNGNVDKAKVVLGGGNPYASIMFVGEAPGEQEIIHGKPFVGNAGKNFEKFLENLSLTRNDVYVSNVVKIRPTKTNPKTGRIVNRPPSSEEIELSRRFLDEEITVVSPKMLVALGNVPLKRLTNTEGITKYHGKMVDSTYGIKTFCLFHPATLIYNRDPQFKEMFYHDLNILKKELEKIY